MSALNHVCVTELLKETKGGKKLLEIDLAVKDEINQANLKKVLESDCKEDVIGFVLELSTASQAVKDDEY